MDVIYGRLIEKETMDEAVKEFENYNKILLIIWWLKKIFESEPDLCELLDNSKKMSIVFESDLSHDDSPLLYYIESNEKPGLLSTQFCRTLFYQGLEELDTPDMRNFLLNKYPQIAKTNPKSLKDIVDYAMEEMMTADMNSSEGLEEKPVRFGDNELNVDFDDPEIESGLYAENFLGTSDIEVLPDIWVFAEELDEDTIDDLIDDYEDRTDEKIIGRVSSIEELAESAEDLINLETVNTMLMLRIFKVKENPTESDPFTVSWFAFGSYDY